MPHLDVTLTSTVDGCFTVDVNTTRQEPHVGAAGNLSHQCPHRPVDLATARAAVGQKSRTVPAEWMLMGQIHSATVATVTPDTPAGTQFRDVDALVTTTSNRTLGVFTADCLPVLIAGPTTIAAVHAGRAGIASRILTRTVHSARDLGDSPEQLTVVIGPAIGGCCYELPAHMVEQFDTVTAAAKTCTTWGSPSLDLVCAAQAELAAAGVTDVTSVGICTACDPQWFSHRRDPNAGRALALITRREVSS